MTISQSAPMQTQTLPIPSSMQASGGTQPLSNDESSLPVLNLTKPVNFSKGLSNHTKQQHCFC